MHSVYKLSDNMIVKMEVGSFELRMLLLETSGEMTVELQTVRCTLYINLKSLGFLHLNSEYVLTTSRLYRHTVDITVQLLRILADS